MSFLITNHCVTQDFSWTWSYPIFHKYFCKNIYIAHITTSFWNKMASILCIQAYGIVYPWKCLNFINHTYSTAFNFYKSSLFYFSKLGWNEGYHAANSTQQKGNLKPIFPGLTRKTNSELKHCTIQWLSYLVHYRCHFMKCLSHFLHLPVSSYSILDLYSKLKVFPSNISLKSFMVYTYTQNQISLQSFFAIFWLLVLILP